MHFHVPIFADHLGPFRSTREHLATVLAEVRRTSATVHLEVETYTWDVIPPEHRPGHIDDAIARELAWTKKELGG